MERVIWVVMGSTGEYSDRNEWLVVAYEDEATAKRHAFDATARALRFSKATCQHGKELRDYCHSCGRTGYELIREWMGSLDPEAPSMYYTGSDYVALPVPLRAAPASPPESGEGGSDGR